MLKSEVKKKKKTVISFFLLIVPNPAMMNGENQQLIIAKNSAHETCGLDLKYLLWSPVSLLHITPIFYLQPPTGTKS